MGDFPGGVLIPGHLRISRGFPRGGWSLGYRPRASISSSIFDFPTLSTISTDVDNNNHFNNEIFL